MFGGRAHREATGNGLAVTPASNTPALKKSLKKLPCDSHNCKPHPQPRRGPLEGLQGGGCSPRGLQGEANVCRTCWCWGWLEQRVEKMLSASISHVPGCQQAEPPACAQGLLGAVRTQQCPDPSFPSPRARGEKPKCINPVGLGAPLEPDSSLSSRGLNAPGLVSPPCEVRQSPSLLTAHLMGSSHLLEPTPHTEALLVSSSTGMARLTCPRYWSIPWQLVLAKHHPGCPTTGSSLLPGMAGLLLAVDRVVAGGRWLGQNSAAVPAVTRKLCVLYRKLSEVIGVVQTRFILAGFTAGTELALFSALKFSLLTRC